MFLFPSKPKIIYDPDKLISTLKDLGKLQNYRVQIKKNGCRAIPSIENQVKIYGRQKTILTVSIEKDWSPLTTIFPNNTLLDGELIGRKQGEISNRLYLWDMPLCGGQDLTQVSYDERYQEMKHLLLSTFDKNSLPVDANSYFLGALYYPEWIAQQFKEVTIGIAESYPAEKWQELLESGGYTGSAGENEGLVFKDITHSLSWNRYKTREIPEQVKFLLKYLKNTNFIN